MEELEVVPQAASETQEPEIREPESQEPEIRESTLQKKVPFGWVVTATAVMVAAIIGFFVFLFATSDPQQSTLIGRGIVGQPAPAIDANLIDGGTFSLDHHLGKWVVVNFFGSWCVGCIQEHPELEKFYERHREDNYATLVTVVFNDTKERVLNSVMGDADWPVVFGERRDDTGDIAVAYSVTALPETYVISPQGVIVEKLVGASGVTADSLDLVIARESRRIAEELEAARQASQQPASPPTSSPPSSTPPTSSQT